ncbi:hypothetical protein NQ317_000420 [Molorchus minor]|uniref:Amino acid transporter n=1 Tax=Molorchus minor TaxID=1323400 RepID=A0ABQ9JYQ3_9CUCU|nr:hypothetical protein NQ317_000420 [Molorchus minor]
MPHYENVNSVDRKVKKSENRCITCLKTNLLVISTFTGVVLGVILGFVLRQTREWTVKEMEYIGFIGQLFLQMLKSLIVPLITSSLVSAIACGPVTFRKYSSQSYWILYDHYFLLP